MFDEAIKKFPMQFAYEPEIENQDGLGKFRKFIVVGMGGSNHPTGLLKIWRPDLQIVVHRNYGLPLVPKEDLKNTLVILSSYSGNTEEVIDAFRAAGKEKLTRAVISTGGKLLELAKKEGIPYVQIPDTKIQPRSAVGFIFKALLKVVGTEDDLREVSTLSESLDVSLYEDSGRELAERLEGFVPIIYSSLRNGPLAYYWKIVFNETGKIPAFYNVLPELNHNEMTGFSAGGGSAFGGDDHSEIRKLSEKFHFIFLRDKSDHPRILKRMEILEKLYRDRDFKIETVELEGRSALHKIFSSVLFANWSAYYTALHYKVDPEQVPMVEEFKKLIK